jgi:stage II sporulation protein AA (anti-sigma F factor antagonist)
MVNVNLSDERVQESPRVVVVRIHGEIDSSNGKAVEEYFETVLEREQPRHVLLDLGGVTYGDSAFFSSLLFWREELTKRGGQLVLFALRPEVLSTMRILALDRVLTVKPDRAAAQAGLLPDA